MAARSLLRPKAVASTGQRGLPRSSSFRDYETGRRGVVDDLVIGGGPQGLVENEFLVRAKIDNDVDAILVCRVSLRARVTEIVEGFQGIYFVFIASFRAGRDVIQNLGSFDDELLSLLTFSCPATGPLHSQGVNFFDQSVIFAKLLPTLFREIPFPAKIFFGIALELLRIPCHV